MLSIYYTQKTEMMKPAFWQWCRQQLPERIITKIDKKRSHTKVQTSILGYLLLQEALRRNHLDESLEMLHCSQEGRPSIAPTFDFNISHSDQYVVCALSKQHHVGLDIEKMKPISLAVLRTFFNHDEWIAMHQKADSQQGFYQLWTQKEAVVKADGRGLNVPLKDIVVSNNQSSLGGNTWFLQEIPLNHAYMMHVATDQPIYQYQRVKISFKQYN
jgi:4'-phosphopantetheinyl transferase